MSISNQFKRLASSCLILSSTIATQAVAEEGMEFQFSGFASVQAAKTTTGKNEGEVWSNGEIPEIPRDWELSKFNKVGLRLDVDMGYNLDFAAQFVSYGRYNYEPTVDWLYVRYNFTPEINISVGKTRIPLYMYSDVLDVGYAYQWIAPPPAVYGVDPLRANDGIQFNWSTEIAKDWYSDLTIWGGQTSQDIPELGADAKATGKDAIGIAWDVEYDWLNLRAVYYTSRGTATNQQLNETYYALGQIAEGLAPLGADLSEVLDRVIVEDKRSHVFTAGMSLDFDTVFVLAEGTFVRTEDSPIYHDVNAFYVTAGYRLPADVTLSVTYSNNNNNPEGKTLGKYLDQVSPIVPLVPFIPDITEEEREGIMNAINGGGAILNAIDKSDYKLEQTYTFGARWDFHPMAAAKMEYIFQEREKYNDLGTSRFTVYPQAFRFSLDLVF